MIKLTMQSGRNIPQFFCDSCGGLIDKAGAAATVFPNFNEEGEATEVKHVHKDFFGGNCLTKTEALIRAQGRQPGWEELSTHIACLVANVGLDANDIAAELESTAT